MREPLLRTTDTGYINRNNQCTIMEVNIPGNDHNQPHSYILRCTVCSYKYRVNGTDIWQRKCPKCQNGTAAYPCGSSCKLKHYQTRTKAEARYYELPGKYGYSNLVQTNSFS